MLHNALGPAAAAVSAALMSLGGGIPERVALALHGGTCWACLTGDECDGGPSDDDCALAYAFSSTLEVLAVQAEPSFRAHSRNRG